MQTSLGMAQAIELLCGVVHRVLSDKIEGRAGYYKARSMASSLLVKIASDAKPDFVNGTWYDRVRLEDWKLSDVAELAMRCGLLLSAARQRNKALARELGSQLCAAHPAAADLFRRAWVLVVRDQRRISAPRHQTASY